MRRYRLAKDVVGKTIKLSISLVRGKNLVLIRRYGFVRDAINRKQETECGKKKDAHIVAAQEVKLGKRSTMVMALKYAVIVEQHNVYSSYF